MILRMVYLGSEYFLHGLVMDLHLVLLPYQILLIVASVTLQVTVDSDSTRLVKPDNRTGVAYICSTLSPTNGLALWLRAKPTDRVAPRDFL